MKTETLELVDHRGLLLPPSNIFSPSLSQSPHTSKVSRSQLRLVTVRQGSFSVLVKVFKSTFAWTVQYT